MEVRFWGTRGSLAKPGPSTLRYGGNTSCVEVKANDGTLIVLDCGTGAHELGQKLAKEPPGTLRGSLLISHTHWDHIQGIPFFAPFFIPGNEWDIYAPQGFSETLRTTLAGQMEYTYFPITAEAFGATLNYHHVSEGVFEIGSVKIHTRFLNHPALTIGYRIEADGASVVYACDHEPHSICAAHANGELEGQDRLHSEFLRNADLVIHDAQYTAEDYSGKVGWGHSTVEYAVNVCAEAGVRMLALTHHDPLRDDVAVDALLEMAKSQGRNGALEVIAASEGLAIELTGKSVDPTGDHHQATVTPAVDRDHCLLVLTTDQAFYEKLSSVANREGLPVSLASSEFDLNLALKALPPALLIIDGATFGSLPALHDLTLPIIIIGKGGSFGNKANVEHVDAGWTPEYLRARIRTWVMRGKFGHVPASIPEDEVRRLKALYALGLIDTPREERFDRITRTVARVFDVPISLITLLDKDRQWFKSNQGLHVKETPRHMSFCAHAIADNALLVVNDALNDERFAANPLVIGDPRIRFYAGVPVRCDGQPVGTLCIIDTRPRDIAANDITVLQDFGSMVEHELSHAR